METNFMQIAVAAGCFGNFVAYVLWDWRKEIGKLLRGEPLLPRDEKERVR